jgi:urease accessory protein
VDSERAAVRSLVSDDRAAAHVGRRARLELTFGCRGRQTVLKHSYAEPPFRVGPALPDGDGLHLILASSAPGIFGGDDLRQTIVVEPGARVRLTSQSAVQVHADRTGALAMLRSTYRVEGGARLACEWDPTIPFPGAALEQRIAIEVASDATLLWSDALMAGREARGERWQFSRLFHELRLTRDCRLAYLERYDLTRNRHQASRRWIAGNSCYFGTLLGVGPAMTRDLAARIHGELNAAAGRWSADLIEHELLLCRLAADEGTTFHHARTAAVAGIRPLAPRETDAPTRF